MPLYYAKGAADRRAQRRVDHGGRRSYARSDAGERAGHAESAVPDARLLSAHGRHRVQRGRRCQTIVQEMPSPHIGAAGAHDRSRRDGVHGEEEARRLFLRDLAARSKGLLRFITCGSVDDGKSRSSDGSCTKLKILFEDHLTALEADSRRWAPQGDDLDFALLIDGLAAEREQGITIDVAYRFFSTDTPEVHRGRHSGPRAVHAQHGHRGVDRGSRRHPDRRPQGRADTNPAAQLSRVAVGIRRVVLAVNKMDLVDYAEDVFARIEASTVIRHADRPRATSRGPVSALKGDNIAGAQRPHALVPRPAAAGLSRERCEIDDDLGRKPFRLPVQWVNRPNLDFRGFAGTVASGIVRPGDRVRVLPSGPGARWLESSRMMAIWETAVAGQSITLTLDRRGRCEPRRRHLRRPTHRRKSPTSSRRPSSG